MMTMMTLMTTTTTNNNKKNNDNSTWGTPRTSYPGDWIHISTP